MSDNITSLAEAREKSKKKTDKAKDDDVCKAERHRILIKHINGKKTDLFNGEQVPFPSRFYLIKTEEGERELLQEIEPDVVKYISDLEFKCQLATFIERNLFHHEWYPKMTGKMFADFYTDWVLYTPTIEKPRSFKFKSESGLCFSKLDFDPIPDDGSNCPLFAELVNRIETNRSQFLAFLGSLFFAESDRQQYVWVHGQGQNGKGSLLRLLGRIFGSSYASRRPPPKNSKNNFWNNGLLGKRLVVFSDCEELDFPTSEPFKMMSGGDTIPTEKKWRDEVTSTIDCKFLFASNYQLKISGQKSDKRRAIYCRFIDTDVEMDPTYEPRLWLEAPHIIGWCMNEYKRICPKHGQIEADEKVNRDLAEDSDSDMAAIWNTYFNLNPKGAVANTEIDRLFKFEFGARSKDKVNDFRRWVDYYHHLKLGRIYVAREIRPRGLIGASLKVGNCYVLDCNGNSYKEVKKKSVPVDHSDHNKT